MIKNEWLLRYHRWCWGPNARPPTVKDFIVFNVSFYALMATLLCCVGIVIMQVSSVKHVRADTNYHNDLIYLIDALKESNRLEQKQNEILQRILDEVRTMNRDNRPLRDLKRFDGDR